MSAAPGHRTVTLLFTDIEGSTRLARELGDEWAGVVARHHGILKDAIEGNGGFVDGTEGDAFFAIFPSAQDGVAAAIEAQRRLHGERWPGQAVKVRMGLHTGEVRRAATGYVGLEIHRGARVAASAHGGQVLLTRATRDAAGADHDAEDLGEHRLKDFPEPERLFHLVVDGRTAEQFPPPKTLLVRPTNVPVLETTLVGRGEELNELHERLADGTRLLTLTGQAGAGKSRLAIAAAEDLLDAFPGGTWFVPLADVTDEERMLALIADKLRLGYSPGQSALETLGEHLRGERTLIVLDNLEQLQEAASVVGELLAAAPTLKVLATSQAPLRLAAELVMPLAPLPLHDGRRLFLETAARRRRELDSATSAAAIDAICERLGGLPLAIELAAARTSVLSPEELLNRLDRSFELLRVRDPGRPERHRSMRAAIAWSFALLSGEGRHLCADLSLFATPFTLADAEVLGGGEALDGLEELLDFSFLRRIDTGTGETRFTMAQTLREFGREQLVETARAEPARRRHAEWALGLEEDAVSQAASDPLCASDRVWRRLDDIYAAFAWARDSDPKLHLRLCATLADALIWVPRGCELDAELTVAVERDPARGPDLARALSALGAVQANRGDNATAISVLQRAATLWRELGDAARTIDALLVIVHAGIALDLAIARASAEEALVLARSLGEQAWIDRSTAALAQVDVAAGEVARVEPLIADALKVTRDPEAALGLRHLWADCALIGGDAREAAARYAAAIRALPALDQSPAVAVELQGLAMSLARAGRAAAALEVDRIASAYAKHFNVSEHGGFWERLREENLEPARASLPTYAPSQPLDDLAAARDWALGIADDLTAIRLDTARE